MRVLIALLLALALSACQVVKPEPNVARSKPVDGGIAEGIFRCRGPAGPSEYPKCSEVPVIVLLNADGACRIVIPYAELSVLGGPGSNAGVTWNLHAPEGYEFIQTAEGAVGVQITKRAECGDVDPATVYEGREFDQGDKRRLKWKLKATRSAACFNHQVFVGLVKHNQVVATCKPADPVIHNDAN